MVIEIKTVADFLKDFLLSKSLLEPDGRPLYEYKISNGRYGALKILLTDKWEENPICFAAFLLYAVEFLRAESDEGHLQWGPIFDSIKKQHLNTAPLRTMIVENGVKYWKRKIFKGQHREFLETLRFESGLPNSSLHDNNNLSALIKSTFQQLESYLLSEEELVSFIESKIDRYPIPQVLCQETFYQLVTKLCFKFLNFKQRFDLAEQPNPTEYLQTQLTDWREEMPLKIEGDRMNKFFDKILSDISSVKKLEPLILSLDTFLTENNGEFSLKSILKIPTGSHSPQAIGLTGEEFDKLPGYFLWNIEIEDKVKYLTSFNKHGNGKISPKGSVDLQIPLDLVDKEWVLSYSSENRDVIVKTELSKFFKIESSRPLVFVEESPGKWLFKGSAPLKIKESTCRILSNDSLHAINPSFEKLGETNSGLNVYQVDSDCTFYDYESQSDLIVSLAQENENIQILDFSHRRLIEFGSFDFLKDNEKLYLGFPKVHLFDKKTGLKKIFLDRIEVMKAGNVWEVFSSEEIVGRNKFRFKDRNGNVLGVKNLCILPVDFIVTIFPNSNEIQLFSSVGFNVFLSRSRVRTEINSLNNSVQLKVDSEVDDVSKNQIEVGISLNAHDALDLQLPNPNFTEVFVSGDGKVVQRASYSISRIHGLSISNSNYNGIRIKKTYKLKLEDLYNREATALEITKVIWIEPFSTKRQALYQWSQQLYQLFALTTNTRSKVRISSEIPHHYIEISKYDLELIFDGTTRLLSVEDLTSNVELSLSAFRLDQVFNNQDVVRINLAGTSWPIMDYLPSDGVWFVFSEFGSEQSIIPKVIIKGEGSTVPSDDPIDYLYQACFLDYDSRIYRFKEFFDTHYLNFDHPVWKELYELFQASDHLPISALDVWKGLVKSPKGMLTFFFSDYYDPNLILKISQELGFIWQLVSVYKWEESFSSYLENLNSKYPNTTTIRLRSEKLSEIQNVLGLQSLVDLLNKVTGPISVQLIASLLKMKINGQEGTTGVRTRHRHPEGEHWASFAGGFIDLKYRQLPDELKNILPDGLHSWQKPVVYLPIILAYHSIHGRFIRVQELNPEVLLGIKLNMDFDQTYFDDVFSCVQGFCYFNYSTNSSNF
uniref:STY4851/ECs_5259 family protein n=1 Tax=Algoriphagus sp. TaxID=1872435 RepID=UPI0040473F22